MAAEEPIGSIDAQRSSCDSVSALFSLYVGDLDSSVTEEQLVETFSKFQGFSSAVLCTDAIKKQSLCYGYVSFHTLQSAKRALETLNHTVMNGKAIRVMWLQPNSQARLSGIGNVFVKNLASTIDNLKLNELFSEFGDILSCKVAVSADGKSKGFGFVQYSMEESALNAIEKLNGSTIEGKELYVGQFIRRADRIGHDADGSFNNLYIKNLDENVTEELLEEKFSKFGKITSLVISKDVNGCSKGFGFVNFENPDDAKRAKEAIHQTTLGSKVLYVARAQKKAEREAILRFQFDKMLRERAQLHKGQNLYVKNINDDVNDMQLKEHFSHCGRIFSAKIMRNEKGISRGFGFVCFTTPEEANRAINTLNGVLFHGKPLYVAVAQTKNERKAYLQMLYAEQALGVLPPLSSTNAFAAYPTVYHRPVQVYQAPDFRPKKGLNGFATQMHGHTRPSLLPTVPNSARQYGGRRNGHGNFPMPFTPQYLPGPSYKHSGYQQQRAGRVGNNNTANGHPRVAALSSITTSQPHEDLSSLLAAASPDKRKDILAQGLYPLVKKLKYDLSQEITQILLEMDNSELLVLLDSPELLAAKAEEAMKMLELRETKARISEANR